MKKGTVFVLAALVIIAAVLFFTQSWIIPSADPYFDGYIFLVASSDGYNLGYKLFTNKKFETVSVKNFDDLHKKLEKYVSEMDELEMLEVPDYLFMDKDDKIIYPVVRATHNSKLHIRHEHHYEILKIIKDFEAQVFLKTADGEKYQSFTVLDFVEIDPDLIPPEIDDGEFADKATDEVLIAALEYAFIGNIFCYSYSDPTAAVECVAERCLPLKVFISRADAAPVLDNVLDNIDSVIDKLNTSEHCKNIIPYVLNVLKDYFDNGSDSNASLYQLQI